MSDAERLARWLHVECVKACAMVRRDDAAPDLSGEWGWLGHGMRTRYVHVAAALIALCPEIVGDLNRAADLEGGGK